MTLTLKGRGGYVVALKGQGACTCHEEEEGNEQEHLESSFPGYVESLYGQNTSSEDVSTTNMAHPSQCFGITDPCVMETFLLISISDSKSCIITLG